MQKQDAEIFCGVSGISGKYILRTKKNTMISTVEKEYVASQHVGIARVG